MLCFENDRILVGINGPYLNFWFCCELPILSEDFAVSLGTLHISEDLFQIIFQI